MLVPIIQSNIKKNSTAHPLRPRKTQIPSTTIGQALTVTGQTFRGAPTSPKSLTSKHDRQARTKVATTPGTDRPKKRADRRKPKEEPTKEKQEKTKEHRQQQKRERNG